MNDYNIKVVIEGREGNLDYNIIEQILKKEGLIKKGFKIEGGGNKAEAKEYLETLQRTSGFDVCLVVLDLDEEDKEKEFKNILKIFGSKKFNLPSKPGDVTKPENRKKGLGVFLLPDNKNKGSMDTLAYQSLKKKFAIYSDCVDELLDCFKLKGFEEPNTQNQKSKFYYQTLVSALAYKNQRKYKFLDLDSEALNPLKEFFKKASEIK